MRRSVDLYFDFISPYAWLALVQAETFAEQHQIELQLRPVVYAAILEERGLIGPVEEEAKRRYTFGDVLRSARAAGRRMVGPPAHPFRSMSALRLLTSVVDGGPKALQLAAALATACWEDGRDLEALEVLAEVGVACGFEMSDLKARINAPEVKLALRDNTNAALEAGVFGVPTFSYRGELFWGQDRMGQLAAVLDGRADSITPDDLERMLARPRGVVRRKQ